MRSISGRAGKIWRGRAAALAALAGAALGTAWSGTAHGQELMVMGGSFTNPPVHGGDDRSAVYAYAYQQNLTEHWYATYTYLNEGHVSGHHRDGHSLQLWWRWLTPGRRLALSLGAGGDFVFDTITDNSTGTFENRHGVALIGSAAATWYIDGGPWMLQLRYNHTQGTASTNFNTNTLLLGLGYQLDHTDRDGPLVPPGWRESSLTRNDATLFGGVNIDNSFDSQHAFAMAAEYRRGIWRGVEGTVSYIREGNTNVLRRSGVAAQAWVSGGFFNDRLTLGLGAGPYYAASLHTDGPGAEPSPSRWAGLLTISASYRLGEHWLGRVSWNRVVTSYDRDADLILAGVGYRF
jgi:hypothetical protein